jgi:arsenate reductase
MGQHPLLVLFLSTGNAARSLIAESLLNSKQSGIYRARSAGTAPLDDVPLQTRRFLEQAGFETFKLHPKRWQDFYKANQYVPVDVIITLSQEARDECPASWLGDPVRVHWAVDDPLGAVRADVAEWKFRKCLSLLDARISALVQAAPPVSSEALWLRLRDISMVV